MDVWPWGDRSAGCLDNSLPVISLTDWRSGSEKAAVAPETARFVPAEWCKIERQTSKRLIMANDCLKHSGGGSTVWCLCGGRQGTVRLPVSGFGSRTERKVFDSVRLLSGNWWWGCQWASAKSWIFLTKSRSLLWHLETKLYYLSRPCWSSVPWCFCLLSGNSSWLVKPTPNISNQHKDCR